MLYGGKSGKGMGRSERARPVGRGVKELDQRERGEDLRPYGRRGEDARREKKRERGEALRPVGRRGSRVRPKGEG